MTTEPSSWNPPRELMRLARRTGGTIEKGLTRFDTERGGRVLELTVFWPGESGYETEHNGGPS